MPVQVILPPMKPLETGPRVAIILDDAGHNTQLLDETLNLPFKVNVAILPRLKHSKEIAGTLHQKGYELLLHQPMEPSNGMDPGPGAILTAMSDEEIQKTLLKNLEAVPHISGVNNHMGSKATTDKRVMEAVLVTASQKKLFFIDSLTAPSKVKEASKSVPQARLEARDLFLDNERDVEAIKKQLRKLKEIAVKQGEAIAIGHFYPETLQALAEMAPEFEKEGIRVVPVSQLVD